MSGQGKSPNYRRREDSPLLTGRYPGIQNYGNGQNWLESNGLESCEVSTSSQIEPPVSGQSIFGAVFIIVNACLGAGLLNFPAAFGGAGGIAVSVALQTILVVFAAIAMLVLAYCSDIHQSKTYETAVAALCGKTTLVACQITVILYAFGTCITFLIIIGDQLDKVFEFIHNGPDFSELWYFNRKFTITIVAVLLILPLCFAAKIEFLKYSSIFGVLATVYVVAVVVYNHYSGHYTPPTELQSQSRTGLDAFIAVPVICFGFQCHLSSVPVYATLQPHTLKSYGKVVFLSLAICYIVYLLTGVFGYLTFGDQVKSDVLLSYHANDISVTVARFMISVSVLTSYPILHFVGRAALQGVLSSFGGVFLYFIHYREKIFRIIEALIWFTSTVLLALFIPNIGSVISVIGCLAAAFILVYPGLCLFRAGVTEVSEGKYANYSLTTAGFIFIVLGAFVFGESLTMAIYKDIHGTPT
ncbi:sodium-coupled neutral amino acid transporter 7-like [Ptychodera flava]|uniref:sodium-coupled neutral amino acid transporter 7-like n=1 Tax=Ptychodera flava TaxID=63121 RepID=UPI003969E9A2